MERQKLCVLGLDGATFDLIGPWVLEGKLPAFSRLMKEGAWGELESVPNQRSGAAWTSFMTGKNPGKHGIFEFYEYLPSSYNVRFINSKARDGRSLWRILSGNQKRVGVINVPMTYPAEEVNGFLIAGLDCPSVKSKGFTYPPQLFGTLERKFGSYILEPGLTGSMVGGKTKEAVVQFKEELRQKMEITRFLKKNYRWDFFMVVLRSLDAVQHCFWKYMDSTHPDFNHEESRLYGDTIFNAYRMIDDFIGELTASLDNDTSLMVMSDHGFGQKHPASNQMNQWLESKGFLGYTGLPRGSAPGATALLGRLYKEVIGKTPRKIKEWMWETLPSLRDRVQSRLCFANIDWSKTVAYSDSLFPNVRINLKGRELQGIVEPGDECERLIERLINDLKDMRDFKTGENIVSEVFRREEIYDGKYVDRAPELLVRWKEDLIISGIRTDSSAHRLEPSIPFIPGEDHRVISGDHHLKGIFLFWGRGIKRGVKIEGAKIIDLAPSILYRMGVPVPDDLDGKILSSVFEESFLKANPWSYEQERVEGKSPRSDNSGDYSSQEKKEIELRLRGLGYLE